MKIQSLKEYKKRCPNQWKEGVGYRIIMALYLNEQKLNKNKLQGLTELNNSDFTKGLEGGISNGDVLFNETSKGRKYFIPSTLRESLDIIYNSL